jgi:hypothetical protein
MPVLYWAAPSQLSGSILAAAISSAHGAEREGWSHFDVRIGYFGNSNFVDVSHADAIDPVWL